MSLQATSGDNIIFSEQFVSVQSVNANGGVVTGTPDFNRKGVFEVGEYVDYPNKQIDFKDAFTITGKVKLTSDSGGGGVVKDDTGSSENYNFVLYQSGSSTNLRFYVVTASGTTDTGRVDFGLNEEHRFTCVYDKSLASKRIKLYKDDQLGSEVDGYAEDCLAGFTGLSIASYAEQFAGEIKDVQCFDKALTAEEIKDLYEQDTIPELDRPLIDLPLRSSYYKATGVEVVTNGGFDDATGWTAPAVWSISGGTANTTTGAANNLYQTSGDLTVGKKYRLTYTITAISSGSYKIYCGATTAGIIRTTAGTFTEDLVCSGDTRVYVVNALDTVGSIDNISVELMEAHTENKGTLGGTVTLGDGTTTTFPTQLSPHGASFDGGDYVDLGTPPTSAGSMGCVFSGAPENQMLMGSKDTDERCYLALNSVGGDFSGGIGTEGWSVISSAIDATSGLHTGIITWDGTTVSLYLDGVQVYSGAQDGVPTNGYNIYVGAYNNGGSAALSYGGNIYKPFFTDKVLTPRQAKILHNEMMKTLNV